MGRVVSGACSGGKTFVTMMQSANLRRAAGLDDWFTDYKLKEVIRGQTFGSWKNVRFQPTIPSPKDPTRQIANQIEPQTKIGSQFCSSEVSASIPAGSFPLHRPRLRSIGTRRRR